MIGFSPEFKKSIKRVEKKLKGRILDALEWLSKEPASIQGNTVKPLSGEFDGLWRYRIGNYRLIYKPDNENKRVTLLTFSSRSSAY
jgi:addiction module RelE/StbE family toxin